MRSIYRKKRTAGWRMVSDVTRTGYRHELKIPGIYAFKEWDAATRKFKTIYIGKSTDLSNRLLPPHNIEARWEKDNPLYDYYFHGKLLYCFIHPTADIDEKEVAYIKRLRPAYNVVHNSNYKRVVKTILVNG